MATKKMTHVVNHKKLYLSIDGKLQHVKQGTQLVLSKEQAEALGGKVVTLKEAEALDLTGGSGAPNPPAPAPSAE